MNISYNWLKRYIDTDLGAEEVARILTDIGLEVEGFEKIETIKGGLAGVGLSFAVMPVVEMLGVRCEASLWGAVLAFLFAMLTGTVFGFYPAWKASRLVPIQALNLN